MSGAPTANKDGYSAGTFKEADLSPFLDRDTEIATFRQMLDHSENRILLLQGPQGMGKSWLLNDMRRICHECGVASVLVDFSSPVLAQPDRVIRHLRERIGGRFAERISEAEMRLQRDFSITDGSLAYQARDFVRSVPMGLQAAGAGAAIGSSVEVGRDFVGRDAITISNSPITIYPGGSAALASEEIEARRNITLHDALIDLLKQQRLVIFFDQYDNATDLVKQWLRYQVLAWQLDGLEEFRGLWTVIAGESLPLSDDISHGQRTVRRLAVGPLPSEDLHLYWIKQHGLSEQILDFALTGSARNTATLFFILRNFATGNGATQT
jgi:hypothetical protein